MKKRLFFFNLSFFLFSGLFLLQEGYTTEATSQPSRFSLGIKWPNSNEEGQEPVIDYAEAYNEDEDEGWKDKEGAFTELLPYVLPSPDQLDAGSCLYMSHTGIVEWWLNRQDFRTNPQSGEDYDLSERYTMNLPSLKEKGGGKGKALKNWRTDSIYLFNRKNQSVSNHHYRFTQGYYKTGPSGGKVPAKPGEQGAKYGVHYNWIVGLTNYQGPYVTLPSFERDVLFADPEKNQWNVTVMPEDIVERVKTALKTRKAPLNVIYNHHGYWHSVILLGYNDNLDSRKCPFVRSNIQSQKAKMNLYFGLSRTATTARGRANYLAQAKALQKMVNKVEKAISRKPCRERGVFLVRDSIYADGNGSLYDYDPKKRGEEKRYSTKIIHREYEWLEILGNHAVQIYLK